MREVDTRIIPGNGGEVAWELDGKRHVITLHAFGITPWIVYRGGDGAQALDAFLHTFARPDVPDVFQREPEVIGYADAA